MNINTAITATTGMGYPWLLIFKGKHGDRNYLITCPTDIQWACYEVAQDRIEWITREDPPVRPEGLKTKSEIEVLPEYLQKTAFSVLQSHQAQVAAHGKHEALCDLADKVKAGDSIAAVQLVIKTRHDEYWGYECETLLRPPSKPCGKCKHDSVDPNSPCPHMETCQPPERPWERNDWEAIDPNVSNA